MGAPTSNPLAPSLRSLLEQAASDLPPNSFTFTVEETSDRDRPGWDLVLRPTHADAATVRVHTTEGVPDVNLMLGEGTFFEYLLRSATDLDEPVAQEIESLVKAVLAGGLTEELWYLKGQLVKSKSTVMAGHTPVTTSWCERLGKPLAKKERITRTYPPFARKLP